MLSLLKIQNLALVETLNWSVEHGLTAITGETGAGKSVIIGALKLIAGARADKGLIRTGADKSSVHAVFHLANSVGVDAILDDAGFDPCHDGELIIRRSISSNSTKQFINDTPCSLGLLKQIGTLIMDLHGPHDHQSLFLPEWQLELVDRFSNLGLLKSEYGEKWAAYAKVKRELNAFKESEMLSEQELDLYRYQVDEITSAQLNVNEISELEERYQRASNAAKLSEHAHSSLALFSKEGGVLDQLNELLRESRELERLDPAVREDLQGVDTARVELLEIESTMRQYVDQLEIDPNVYAELEARLELIESLKRKYGGTIEDVLAYEKKVSQKLAKTEQRDEMLAQFERDLEKHQNELHEIAQNMSESRRSSAPKIARDVQSHLKDLGFKQSVFEVRLAPLKELSKDGLETIEFQFGPNVGEPTKPLHQIASSGEMSRVMLSLKTTLAKHDETPLIIFDEIDANVGGEIATAVGRKMSELSETRQVLSITHFPQVAAIAPYHCLVEKIVSGDRTVSTLSSLDGEKRVSEVVRMLGSKGEHAEALARSMLSLENHTI